MQWPKISTETFYKVIFYGMFAVMLSEIYAKKYGDAFITMSLLYLAHTLRKCVKIEIKR